MIKISNSEVGIFSDPHYGLHRNSGVWHKIALDHAKWAAKQFKSRSIKDIIIPGDVFDDRNDIAVNTINVAADIFDILSDFNIIITVGNHDAYYKDKSDVNSVSILRGRPNITVVDKLLVTKYNKTSIALCPWGQNIDEIPKCDLIVGHFEINSFKMNSCKVCVNDHKPADFSDKAKLTISGHFHLRDERTYKNGAILYVGCPYQHNWSDYETVKGLHILDLDTLKHEFIENDISPKHNKIFLSGVVESTYKPAELKRLIEGQIVKFVVDCPLEQEKIDLITKKLSSLKPVEFQTEYSYEDLIKVDNDKAEDINFNVSVESSIQEFVDLIEVKHKSKVKDYVVDLYRKAQLT
jgi:DNA repair exonuclease SbcCD nuclease subunit